jgi:adenine-specific DNA-methyltransferase
VPPKKRNSSKTEEAHTKSYRHTEAESLLRPDVGTQSQFKKKKPPVIYRYDSSLSPSLDYDGQSGARDMGEWLISMIDKASALPSPHTFDKPQEFKNSSGQVVATVRGLHDAVEQLKRIGKPFLNWTGKAERLSFDVPTLPLFVHDRLSTKAIIETLKGHRKKEDQTSMFELFGDPQRPVTDQILKAYEYRDKWVNRMVLGDSLVVMSSLLHYEGLGGQVQTIYFDPPYGIKFGSNFQPFIRKRDVSHNEDEDMTREPEMVKAYRDTWELGLHSYLTYMRDRLLIARELLHPTGSIFVQIGEENLHHVRELMDEIYGAENLCRVITYVTTSYQADRLLANTVNYLLWYGKNKDAVKVNQLFRSKNLGDDEAGEYKWMLLPDGTVRSLVEGELAGIQKLPEGSRVFRYGPLTSQGYSEKGSQSFLFKGKNYSPGNNQHWKTSVDGLQRLADKGLLIARENSLAYYMFLDDFPISPLSNVWNDTKWGFDAGDKAYVVQTNTKVIQRCLLMTTAPGDLVLDPTCGSGTTAYVAEQWGRRWITIDTSRVPLALARQRLLTATFPYYQLKDESRGPAGGFVYVRKQNNKGEDVGGIVPHVTLKSIANNEPPSEEVLVDRPETDNKITRVSGAFCVEATIPTPVDWEGDGVEDSGAGIVEEHGTFVDRMLEVLRKSPVLHIGGGKSVSFKNIRLPAKTLSLSAEAAVSATAPGQKPTLMDAVEEADEKNLNKLALSQKPVALLFGPENGAVSEKLVHEALKEANLKGYTHLYVIGFAIQANARLLIENSANMGMIPSTYVQATPDLMMGDLLKNMRSSQIFSVCGLPEVKVLRGEGEQMYQVELLGFDIFDPVTMDTDHRLGNDVPAWFLDTDYNGLSFHVCQAFFPRTSAWDNLKRALKGSYEETVWDHLSGTKSVSFEAGEHGQIAVKVIDDRGNELMVVKDLKEVSK